MPNRTPPVDPDDLMRQHLTAISANLYLCATLLGAGPIAALDCLLAVNCEITARAIARWLRGHADLP